VLAESEAGVWRCVHGGHPKRAIVYAMCVLLTRRQFAPTLLASRASSALSGVPPQIIDRIVILITAFILAQMSE
jgi:hypothetical protein